MKRIKLSDLIEKLDTLEFIGNNQLFVTKIISLPNTNEDASLCFWVTDKNIQKIANINQGVVICTNAIKQIQYSPNLNIIIVANPRNAFRKALSFFDDSLNSPRIVSVKAVISDNVIIGKNVAIGNNTVIEENVTIGDNTVIGHNNAICRGTSIGSNVSVGHNNTIGGLGFGYEKDEEGNYQVIPHIGNVVIEDNVDIGNNTCIDRGVLGSTTLKKGCKLDNLVHIAHNVVIGRNSMVIANAMIAGSVTIGDNVWIAPSASTMNNIEIASNSVIGLGAVARKNTEPGDVIVGNPGKPLRKM
jgi:UDP-3-O-[3-hydroxymyristoyl] glucosamine N-acyltransferase